MDALFTEAKNNTEYQQSKVKIRQNRRELKQWLGGEAMADLNKLKRLGEQGISK